MCWMEWAMESMKWESGRWMKPRKYRNKTKPNPTKPRPTKAASVLHNVPALPHYAGRKPSARNFSSYLPALPARVDRTRPIARHGIVLGICS